MQRILQEIIEKRLFTGKILLLYGARQVGKTTLVKKIMERCADKKTLFLNADGQKEQEILSSTTIGTLERIIRGYDMLIVDEAQQIPHIGKVLKILHDSFPHLQIIATGSSSFDLANKTAEPLTGRVDIFSLYPFSYSEIAKGKSYLEMQEEIPFLLQFGSYPDVFNKPIEIAEKNIRQIAEQYLYKDIFLLGNVKYPHHLKSILRLLAYQIGSEVSYREIGQQLELSTVTVQSYIDLLEKAFVIFKVPAFSSNQRNEVKRGVKIFFYDIGIRNAIIDNFQPLEIRADKGALWENFFASERIKYLRTQQIFRPLYFWRTYEQKEVDFVEEYNGKLVGYECKWNSKKRSSHKKVFLQAFPSADFFEVYPTNIEDFVE